MADAYSQVPELNNIRCVPENVILASKYHLKHQEKNWYKDAIQEWQTERPYKQPIEINDKIYFELHRVDSNDAYFEIYDENGIKIQDRVDANFVIYDANSVYTKPDGTEVQLSVHKWHFRFSDLEDNSSNPLPEGVYRLRFVVEIYSGVTLTETKAWVSEPLDVRETHEDTVYIEYWNDTNKDDVIFQYDITAGGAAYKGYPFFIPKFGLRVHGTLLSPNIDGQNFDFEEQDYEQRLLDGFSWDYKILDVGGLHGVPYYIVSKINKILRCDNKYIDGVRYEIDKGAKPEIKSEDANYPLYEVTAQVRLYDRQESFTDTRGSKFTFVDLTGGDYPKAIYKAGFDSLASIISGVVLTDNTDRASLITYLNTDIADTYDLQGTFSVESGKIVYENAVGENYNAGTSQVIYNPTIIDIDVTVANQKMAFTFYNGKGVIDWGLEINTAGRIFQSHFNASTSANPYYQYEDVDTYTVMVFGEDTLQEIHILSSGGNPFTCDILNMTGNVPEGLRYLYVVGADFSGVVGGFNMDFIQRAKRNLRGIVFSQCGIVALSGNVFENYSSIGIGGNSANWRQVILLSIYLNGLDATELADFIVKYYDHAPHVTPSTIQLGQSPAVSIIDTTALADIDDLRNAGHTVLT